MSNLKHTPELRERKTLTSSEINALPFGKDWRVIQVPTTFSKNEIERDV